MKHHIEKGLKGGLALALIALLSTPVWAAQSDRPAKARVRTDNRARVRPARASVLLPGAGQVNRLIQQIRSLDLTDQQNRTLRQMVRKARPSGQKIQQAIQKARRTLMQAVNRGKDRKALQPAAQALTKAFVDQAVFQVRVREAMLKQLTDEQRQKLSQHARKAGQVRNAKAHQKNVRRVRKEKSHKKPSDW